MKRSTGLRRLTLPLMLAMVLLTSLLLVTSALAEGDQSGGTAPILSVMVEPASMTVEVGKSATATATYTLVNSDGSAVDVSGAAVAYDWYISDQTTASYSNAGGVATVSGVKTGTATLNVTIRILLGASEYTGSTSCAVTVTDAIVEATNLTINTPTAKLDKGLTQQLTATVEPVGAAGTVTWTSEKLEVATVDANGLVTAIGPGESIVTAKVGALQATCKVTVNGVTVNRTTVDLLQNESVNLEATGYGDAGSLFSWVSSKATVASVSGGRVSGVSSGSATLTVTSTTAPQYTASVGITVRDSTAGVISGTADVANPLRFSNSIADEINQRCRNVLGVELSRVYGLTLDSASSGTLYYGYVSESSTGSGVASGKSYYYEQTSGEMLLSGVTFVPKSDFGGTCTITYTGYGTDGRAFEGTIRVSVERAGDVVYSVNAQQPVTFNAGDFDSVCRSRRGVDLSFVTFTLPASTKGTLFYNYSGSTSYDSKVTSGERYYRSQAAHLSKVTFVPAQDATGAITVSYSAQDVNGGTYSGRVTINVAGGGGQGDLSYTVDRGSYVRFSASDFNTACQSATGDTLSYVKFDLPASEKGKLYYNYRSSGTYDSTVSSSTKYYRSGGSYSLGNVSFVAGSGYGGSFTISFTGWDTDGDSFHGTVGITVRGEGSGDISYRTSKNSPITFDVDDFNVVSREHNSYNLKYVTFTLPNSSKGKLYYDYNSSGSYSDTVSSSTRYYRSESPYLKHVTFVPASGYTGTVEIAFTGYDTNNGRFSGTVSIQVGSGSSSDSGDLSYTVSKNGSVTFSVDDFNQASKDYDGYNIRRVSFTPPASSRGYLYYNYSSSGNYDSRVTSSDYYYRNESPYLSKITFVPAKDYTGTVEIDFAAWDTEGTRFTGVVSVKVGGGGSDGNVRTISYSAEQDSYVTFDDGDFNTACRDYNDRTLDYVKFTLPNSSKGTLYYDYAPVTGAGNKVSASTSYSRSGSPYLNRVTFVPAKGVTGTVNITYTGYDTSGGRYTGTVSVTVGGGVSGKNVQYSTAKNTAVRFYSDDFNTASRNYGGYNLDHVKFELPTSSKGTLYIDYTSSSNTGTRVTSSTEYKRSGTPSVDNISFVPASGYVGTVDIGFTAWDAGDGRFSGTVTIQVGNTNFDGTVSYKTTTGKPVTFDVEAFNTVSKSFDGSSLSYVKFTQPSSSVGTLYHNYGGSKESKVSSSTSYNRASEPYLYNLTFVPATSFTGKAEVAFSAWDTSGQKFEGKVAVQVEQPVAQPIRYASTGGVARFQSADFTSACRALMSEDVVKVRFTPPASSSGQLYYGYEGPGRYSGQVSTGTDLYRDRTPDISTVAFIPAPGSSGAVVISYTGEDANGYSFMGTVEIAVPAVSATSRFADLTDYGWAATAVEYLYQNGVVKGTSETAYSPKGPTSRGDFALMIVRAFHFPETAGTENFSDVSADMYYAKAIATARYLGVIQGDGSSFRPNFPVTRQDAMVMLQRAMRAAGVVVNDGSVADLQAFSDWKSVASYAIPSVSSMVRQGVVKGDESGRLNPTSYITRAEMAVILYRALTESV